MERYQVYKKIGSNTFIHVSSLLASSRIEALAISNDTKTNGGGGDYYVSGITRDNGEDISNNFPVHTQGRIANKGEKIKVIGSLYRYANGKKQARR